MASLQASRTQIHQGEPAERVLLLCGDLDRDGIPEIIVGTRSPRSALELFKRETSGDWSRRVINQSFGRLEAGGAFMDITGNGYPDIVAGEDWQGNHVYWWENPGTTDGHWKRRVLAVMPAPKSHDQLAADLDGDGRPELYYWNQKASTLWQARIPANPYQEPWPTIVPVCEGIAEEGLAVGDVNGDGHPELIAGQRWFEPTDKVKLWQHHVFTEGFVSPRLAVADLRGHGYSEILLSEGDASFFGENRTGRFVRLTPGKDPREPWSVQTLAEGLQDPHSLALADFTGNGRCDVYLAELGDPNGKHSRDPRQMVWLNDGKELHCHDIDHGQGSHESKTMLLDGEWTVVVKPYQNLVDTEPRHQSVDALSLWHFRSA